MRCFNLIRRCSFDRLPKCRETAQPRRARWGVRAALVPAAAFSAVSVLGLASAASAQVITWIGPASGDWGTGANWSGNTVPNSSGTTALVDGGNLQATSVSIAGNFTVGTLVISSDQVTLGNNLTLSIPVLLDNAGTLTLAPVANNSTLSTGGASMSISGGGTIVLQGANSVLAGGGTMNNVNNLIRGRGYIGNNNTAINNQGTISADSSGNTLWIDLRRLRSQRQRHQRRQQRCVLRPQRRRPPGQRDLQQCRQPDD